MKYVILTHPPTQEQIAATMQESNLFIRKNIAGTKCVLKYPWPKPAALINVQEYTHDDILVEMSKPEWNLEVE